MHGAVRPGETLLASQSFDNAGSLDPSVTWPALASLLYLQGRDDDDDGSFGACSRRSAHESSRVCGARIADERPRCMIGLEGGERRGGSQLGLRPGLLACRSLGPCLSWQTIPLHVLTVRSLSTSIEHISRAFSGTLSNRE